MEGKSFVASFVLPFDRFSIPLFQSFIWDFLRKAVTLQKTTPYETIHLKTLSLLDHCFTKQSPTGSHPALRREQWTIK